MGLALRAATEADIPLILALVRELAEYEKEPESAKATPEQLRKHLFGPRPYAEAIIADVDAQPAGFALFFHNFSTWTGQPGIYLEDLYVRPEFRGNGVGKQLIAHVARLAVERECGRFEWSVLDWNAPAIGFYRSLGAVGMDEWTVQRLTGDALQALAAQAR